MSRATVQAVVRKSWHDTKKYHVVGQLIVSAGDYATELAVDDLLLVTGEYRNIAAVLTDLTATAGSAYSNNANDTAPKRLDTVTAITGSVDVTASADVVGVGTLFLSQVAIGDYLVIGTATVGEARKVVAITSNLALTVDAAFTNLADDVAPFICKVNGTNGRPDYTTIVGSIDPAASTAITGVNTKFLGQGIPFSMQQADIPSRTAPIWMDVFSRRAGLIYGLEAVEEFRTLTGTVDTAASVTVPGVSTLFTSELRVGDEVLFGIERRFVTAIASDTSLTVNRAHTDQANDTAPKKVVRSPQLYRMRLQIRGLPITGGAAAAGTRPVNLVTVASSVDFSKEEATNALARFGNAHTAALPSFVLDDYIEFHGVFDHNS